MSILAALDQTRLDQTKSDQTRPGQAILYQVQWDIPVHSEYHICGKSQPDQTWDNISDQGDQAIHYLLG